MKTQIRLNSRTLPFLVGLCALFQLLEPSPVWLTLLTGLGSVWLIAYLWARALRRGLRLKRERRFGWTQVGDRMEERFTLRNTSQLPAPWVEVRDETNAPGYNASRVTGVNGRSWNQWRTEGVCSQRGLFNLGPSSLHSGDPLGIYSVRIQEPASTLLMVMPPVVPLPDIEVAAGGYSGEGRPRPRAAERTMSVSGVRPYAEGDSLRLVHWPTTARRDEFHVRVLDGSPAGHWWILLDLNRQVQAGQGWDSTLEHGIILAASLADRGLRERKAVGLVINGQDPVLLTPKESPFQRIEILRALATAKPGEVSLANLLENSRRSIGQGSSLVLITPDTRLAWIEKLLPLLWRGVTPTTLLLDPHTFDGAAARPGEAEAMQAALSRLGLAFYPIAREVLDRPEARPGQAGEWEFRFSPTGRAVAVRRPGDMTWKATG
jgi:uncharacterized protein (DUF58 family)